MRFALVLLGLVAALGIWFLTSTYGVKVTPDSVAYVSTARSLAAGNGFQQANGHPFIAWPPLYPALLALPTSLGVDGFVAARYVNLCLFGLTVMVFGFWLLRDLTWPVLVLGGTLALMLGQPLVAVAIAVWSEPLYCFLIVSFFAVLGSRSNQPPWVRDLALSALAGLGILTRYMGLTLVLTYLVYVGLSDIGWRDKFTSAIRLVFISMSPVALWVLRNHTITSTLTGDRALSNSGFYDNVRMTVSLLMDWLLPAGIPAALRVGLFFAAVVLFAVTAIYCVKTWQKSPSERHTSLVFLSLSAFVVLHLMYLIAATSLFATDPILDRLLGPIYPPLVALLCMMVWQWTKPQEARPWITRRRIAIGVMAAALLHPAMTIQAQSRAARANGAGGFATSAWQHSQVIASLRQHPPDGEIYSNAAAAIYYLAGITCKETPRKFRYTSVEAKTEDVKQLRDELSQGRTCYLAWVSIEPLEHYYTPLELGAYFRLEPVFEGDDGAIYRISDAP